MNTANARLAVLLTKCIPIINACVVLRGNEVPVHELLELRAEINLTLAEIGRQPIEKEAA